MERIELLDSDIERINALGESTSARVWIERLAPDQRDAITAHVLEERGYAEIAQASHTSEAVVRKRRAPPVGYKRMQADASGGR